MEYTSWCSRGWYGWARKALAGSQILPGPLQTYTILSINGPDHLGLPQALASSQNLLGPLLFWIYIFLMFFVVMSMFVALISEAYENAREESANIISTKVTASRDQRDDIMVE